MAEVTVRFYTIWEVFLETKSVDLVADNVEEIINQIEARFGQKYQEQLREHGILTNQPMRERSLFLLNGRSIGREDLDQVKLATGDVVHVFPLVMGG